MSETALKVLKWIGFILGVIVLIGPYIFIYFYMKKQGTVIRLDPKFEIVKVENAITDDGKPYDPNVLSQAITIGKDALKKLKLTKDK